jgi:hypothetical protein
MKQFYILCSAALISFGANSQISMGSSYSLSIPLGEMGDNIRPLHSVNGIFLYALPGISERLIAGAELGIGNYAYISKRQDLRFPDGSGINTMVDYSSNVFNAALLGRINFLNKGRCIPYINVKGGFSSFFSNIFVGDPEDPSSCRALERKNIISAHTVFIAYGGGLQLDLNLFSKKEQPGKYRIDIAVNKIRGGRLDYINTKNLQSHVHTDPNNPAAPGKGEPLNIRFINITTQAIHEHQAAEVYNSPLRMLDIKVGMLFRFGS